MGKMECYVFWTLSVVVRRPLVMDCSMGRIGVVAGWMEWTGLCVAGCGMIGRARGEREGRRGQSSGRGRRAV